MLAQGEWCGRLALSLPTCREHHHGPATHEYPHPRWMARDTRYRTNQEALGQVVGLASTRGFAQRVLGLAWPLLADKENASDSRQRALNALE